MLHNKVGSLQLPEGQKVDVLVSEPMGTLFVNAHAKDLPICPGSLPEIRGGCVSGRCETGAPPLKSKRAAAALIWRLDVLLWAREHGCRWDASRYVFASAVRMMLPCCRG